MTPPRFENKQHKPASNMLRHLAAVILIMANPLAVADDYLDSLKNEAADLEYLDETRPGNAITAQKKSVGPEITRASQSINNFENYFRKQDSASAAIYFRLTTQQRLRIFHRFKTTQNLDVARKMAIEIFNKER